MRINNFQDRIEHLENALTASDCKINDLIDKKIEEIHEHDKNI